LQGRTSPGGAINMITTRASLDETSGYLQGSVSDNDGYNGQVAYGTPLVEDQLGGRVAAVYDTNNGSDFESYQILDLFVGWRSSDFSWDVSLWAKNVTDEDAVVCQRTIA
jgi:outer membrane receptor protein involved in Fe transport